MRVKLHAVCTPPVLLRRYDRRPATGKQIKHIFAMIFFSFLWTPISPISFTRAAFRSRVRKMPVCPGCQASLRFVIGQREGSRTLNPYRQLGLSQMCMPVPPHAVIGGRGRIRTFKHLSAEEFESPVCSDFTTRPFVVTSKLVPLS